MYNDFSVKHIGIAFFLLPLVFLFPHPVNATVINTNLNVQTGTNLRVIATPTPTPTPSRIQLQQNIRVIALPTPTVAPALNTVTDLAAPINVHITSPNGGEKITIGDKDSDVLFTYGGAFDMSVGGNYGYRVELWRNGQALGNVSNFDHFPLNPNQTSVTSGWTPGQYWAVNPQTGTESLKTAEAGDGYAVRVVLVLGYEDPQTGNTKYKDIAEDLSDNTFTLLPKPKTLKAYTQENYTVTLTYPNGGELLPLKKRFTMHYEYGGTFDPEQGGSYDYRFELWQNGKLLGSTHTLNNYQLNINKTEDIHEWTPEYYYVYTENSGKAVKIQPGKDYQLKVILQQGYMPEGGSETVWRELASDMSDKTFTFTPAPTNPFSEALKQVTTPVTSFLSKLFGFLKGGGGEKTLPQ